MDNKIYTHLKVPGYVADWCKYHFGEVVELTRDSPESLFLRHALQLQPQVSKLENTSDCNLCVRLPFLKHKDVRYYNYLSPRNKELFADHFKLLFENNMWSELLQYCKIKGTTKAKIFAYMENHGIDDKHYDALEKKFFRLRRQYNNKKGIYLK